MIWWLAAILALAGAPRERRMLKQAQAEVPPAPPGMGVDRSLVPALVGRTEVLDFKGLTRTSIRYDLQSDGAVLLSLTDETAESLKRQLAADAAWRVSRLHGVWVATERVRAEDGWTAGPEGYHLADESCWRVGVRLGPSTETYPWGGSEAIPVLDAAEGAIRVWAYNLSRPPCTDQQAVALIVEAPAVALEIFDSSDGENIPVVARALGQTPIRLANAAIDSDRIRREGYDASQLQSRLPDEEQAPTLTRTGSDLEFRGALHFEGPGVAWARIRIGGKIWNEEHVADATLEVPGWSPSDTDVFPLQSRIPMGPEGPFRGVLELWFWPDGGDPRLRWFGPVSVD